MDPLLIGGGVVGTLIAIAAVVNHRETRRTNGFKALAEARGFQFDDDSSSELARLPQFKLFTLGHTRRFRNVIRGTKDEASILVGDYHYVTGRGRGRTTHRRTFCLVRSPNLGLPHFFLRPQSRLLDAVGKWFGGKDLDFDDDPEFSRAFVLQSEADRLAVIRLFTPSVRSELVGLAPRGRVLEAWNDCVLWECPKRIELEEIDPLIVDAVNLRRVLAYQTRSDRPTT